jgi:hypothetical protein
MDKNGVLIDLSQHPASRFWKVDFGELTEPERVFRCIWELEADVNNGGFRQYYENSSGDTAYAVESALITIRANQMAAIVREANSLFEDGVPPTVRGERQDVVDSWSGREIEALETLDDRFYQYPDNLTELLYEYVSAHKSDVSGATEVGI